MMSTPFDVLVAGEINPDLILTDPDLEPKFGQVEVLVDNADLTIGSSSVIFACGAAKLGLSVAFIGVVGDDLFGDFMLDSMRKSGIDISNVIVDPDQKTGFTVILNKIADRGMLTYLGAIDALRSEQIGDDLLSQVRHLHIASYFLQTRLRPGVKNVFERANALGVTTSLDTNWDPEDQWLGVRDVLGATTVFLPNKDEGEAISGEREPEHILQELSLHSDVIAMKMGAEGGMAKRGEQVVRVKAPEVDVVDAVGAGDSFDAGFVYGYLQNWSLGDSLKLGVVCGSLSTTAPGGTNGQPTLNAAMDMIKDHYGRE